MGVCGFQDVRGLETRRRPQVLAGRAGNTDDLPLRAHDRGRSRVLPEQQALEGGADRPLRGPLGRGRLGPVNRSGHERRRERRPRLELVAPEDAEAALHGLEQLGSPQRFGRAEEQIPAAAEGVVKHRDEPALQLRVQMDEHVAAGDEIQVQERRVIDHAVPREDAHLSDLACDLVRGPVLPEETPPPLGRNALDGVGGVPARTRLGDRLPVRVGRDDPYAGKRTPAGGLEPLAHEHAQAVGLLARAAAHHPDAHRVLGAAFAGEDPWQEVQAEVFERLGITEELRHSEEQLLRQPLGRS